LYPVKAKGASGLGIHLTLDLEGGVRLGPDAEYVSSKEDFSSREDKRELFRKSAEKLLGPLKSEDLIYDQCGIRPKLRAPHEDEEKDFVIGQDVPNLINLVGIESPGLTSALAIAERVVKLVDH
jgi:glycerol-3-phosphate dehydrogenase